MSKTYEKDVWAIHRCSCPDCCGEPDGTVAREHQAINRIVACTDERSRRLVAGLWPDCTAMGESLCWRGSPGWIATPSPAGDASCATVPVIRAGSTTRCWSHVCGGRGSGMLGPWRTCWWTNGRGPGLGMKWTHRSLRTLRKALRAGGSRCSYRRPAAASAAFHLADLSQAIRRAHGTPTATDSFATLRGCGSSIGRWACQ